MILDWGYSLNKFYRLLTGISFQIRPLYLLGQMKNNGELFIVAMYRYTVVWIRFGTHAKVA